MLHTLNLAMCLNLNAHQFGFGVIAADWTLEQEFNHHPWGNNNRIISAFSNEQFPIHHIGSDHTRSQKARKIIKDPSGVGEKFQSALKTFLMEGIAAFAPNVFVLV